MGSRPTPRRLVRYGAGVLAPLIEQLAVVGVLLVARVPCESIDGVLIEASERRLKALRLQGGALGKSLVV